MKRLADALNDLRRGRRLVFDEVHHPEIPFTLDQLAVVGELLDQRSNVINARLERHLPGRNMQDARIVDMRAGKEIDVEKLLLWFQLFDVGVVPETGTNGSIVSHEGNNYRSAF